MLSDNLLPATHCYQNVYWRFCRTGGIMTNLTVIAVPGTKVF
jgi:hypothetical protein